MSEKEKEVYYNKYLKFVKDRQCHDLRYLINGDKMFKLGWIPKYNFKNGLIKTVKWYEIHADNFWNEKENFTMDNILVPHIKHDIFEIEKGSQSEIERPKFDEMKDDNDNTNNTNE
jgi:hypothetical protein